MTDAPRRELSDGKAPTGIRKVYIRDEERYEIRNTHAGRSICLDASALKSLSWEKPEMFIQLHASGSDGRREG